MTDAEIYDAWIVTIDHYGTGEFDFRRLPIPHGLDEKMRSWWLTNLVREKLIEPSQLHQTFGQLHKRTDKIKDVLDAGGWAMYEQLQATERLDNEDSKKLMRLVNQSTISLNKKTEAIYDFQKRLLG